MHSADRITEMMGTRTNYLKLDIKKKFYSFYSVVFTYLCIEFSVGNMLHNK